MPRMILRATTAIMVLCAVCVNPNHAYTKNLDNGPHLRSSVSHEEDNVSLSCPPPLTVDCDDNGIYQSYAEFEAAGGSANLQDGCAITSFTFVSDTEVSQNGCTFVYMREYFLSESCGNTFTCNQIVMLTDDDDPTITACAPDITLNMDNSGGTCLVAYTVPDITVVDGCSPTIMVTSDSPGNFGIGSTVVTYTATDNCGNSSMCDFTVTVVDNNPITVNCPADISSTSDCSIADIPPYADFAAFMAAGGSASGNCNTMGGTLTISNVDTSLPMGTCPQTYERTYTISDGTNTGMCTQMISIDDNSDPTFTVPADITVDCGMTQDTAVTGAPTNVMDNCDNSPTITFSDGPQTQLSTGCTGEYSFTREWTVTDACMNDVTLSQMITTTDTVAPTAVCKDIFVVYLDENGDAALVADSLDNGSTDNCSEITFTTNMSFVSCNQIAGDIPASLEVTDGCGNMSSCDLTIRLLDTMSVILTAAEHDTIMCIEDLGAPFGNYNEFFLADGEVDDNCLVGNSFTLIDADTTGICPIVVTRIYEYMDISGNSDTSTHSIFVIDEEAPLITSTCQDIIITEMDYCDTLITFTPPTFTDNCNNVVITNSYTGDESLSAIFEGGTYTVSFYATDACGNADTCDFIVDIAADPRITFPPLGTIDSENDLPSYADLDEFLAAGGMVNMFCLIDSMTFTYDPEFEIQPDGCTALVTQLSTFVDTLGESYTSTVITEVMDTLDPVISGAFDQFLALQDTTCDLDTFSFIQPTASDNFGVDTMFFDISEFIEDTATVTFTAVDLCGRMNSETFDLIVFDPTSPIAVVDDITIMCDTMGAAPAYTTINEFLDGPNAAIEECRLDESFIDVNESVDTDGNIIRIYSVRDLAGNDAQVTQTIFIMDNTAPEFTSCPMDITVNTTDPMVCGEFVDISEPVFADNCNGTITLTHNSPFGTSTDNADGTYPVGTTPVSYYIEDENGLRDTCSFTVTVNDNILPDIACPADIDVDCSIMAFSPATDSTSFIALGGTLSDACGIASLSAMIVESSTDVYTITYTAIDNNGNENTCTQTVTVVDNEDPVITNCTPMIFVNTAQMSCDTMLTIDAPNAIDNCAIDTIFNNINNTDELTMVFSDTTEIIWYAFDNFGNFDSCITTVFVIDGIGPLLTPPDNDTVMCVEMVAEIDTFQNLNDLIAAGGTAFDNCGIDTFFIIEEVEENDSIITRRYAAVDSTGNISNVTHTIVIDDTTPPEFAAPVDVTIDCSITLDSFDVVGTVDSMMLIDNCMDTDTLIYIDNTFSTGGCLPNDSIQRIWILTDDSGNEARDTQTINRIDTIAPEFDMSISAINDIACDDALPATEVLTASDFCGFALVTVDTIPGITPASCSDYEIKYLYTATDACNNIIKDSVVFMRLGDSDAPIVIDTNHQVLNTLPGLCGVPVDDVPAPVFMDDCSTITLTNNFNGAQYNLDTTRVTWSATDACNNVTTVTQVIVINDNEPPVVLCKDLNVSLGGDGIAIVQADTLAASITDNCAHFFGNKVTVRRIDNATACENDGMYNKSVTFCCDDIGKSIMVEVLVNDGNGNTNSCTSEVTINNAQLQTNIPKLNDVTISCEFTYNPDDLSIFGQYVDDPADINDTIIEGQFVEDVAYINTCGMTTVTESSSFSTGGCGNDTLTRFFKFDNGVDSFTLQQKVVRRDVMPFTENDIEWPANFPWNQCANPAPDTSISGAPILSNLDFCNQVVVEFKDQLFNYPLTSCPKVKRKWKVIDWCQYDNSNGPANNPGLFTYSQWIFVENDVPATILSACNDTLICAPGNACEALVSLNITAMDDCMADAENLYYSYRIDIGNDDNPANDITGTSAAFTHTVASGIHNVEWSVADRCGNVNNSCQFLITVKECKDPTAICRDGLAIALTPEQNVELWASDLNYGSSDNCTATEDLLISFSSDTNDILKTFTCDDIGNNEVEMWITDAAGNQSFCIGSVDVQDNQMVCTTTAPVLAGKIVTENNVAVPEAMVSILGAEMDEEYMTEDDGTYTFSDLDMQNEYQVQVDRDKDHIDGVTTLDLVLIQRHILGMEELDSPYKLIAADINNSESITAADLLELRKLILGVKETFTDNTSWRFVSKNESMNDMENPWPFSEDLTLQNNNMYDADADFIGVKIGDVNNSSESLLTQEDIEKRSANSLGMITKDQTISRDDQVYIDFISTQEDILTGTQMTITWDPQAMTLIEIVPIGLDLKEYQSTILQPGIMTVAWHKVDGQSITKGLPLFQLVMEGNESALLSEILEINSDVTSAMAYNIDSESMNIDLRFEASDVTDIVFYQNKPNPFLSETTVEFSLPEDMDVTFKIFNNTGKLIHRSNGLYPAGSSTLILDEQLGEHKGILFLKMETAEFSEVKRMIRIE